MHKFHIWKSTKFNAISMKAKRQAKYKSSILPVSCFAISDCNRQGFYGVKSYKVDYNCKNKVQPNFEFLFFRHFINLFFFCFCFSTENHIKWKKNSSAISVLFCNNNFVRSSVEVFVTPERSRLSGKGGEFTPCMAEKPIGAMKLQEKEVRHD